MTAHQSKTNQTKKVQLASGVDTVMWTKRGAAPGGMVGLEVFTHYVGNGSEMQVELSDQSGKMLGRYANTIHNDHFRASIKVPADAREALYATAKLTKHGLTQKSPPLLILPPMQITNAAWDRKEARRGDILKLTADIKGVPDGVEVMIEIWEHDADGVHDFITKFPVQVKGKKIEAEWEYEYHEDTDDIPSHKETEKGYHPPEYFFRVAVGGVTAQSGLLEFKDWIEIELVDEERHPLPNREYVLHLPDGTTKRGKVDADGKVRVENLPPGPVTVELVDS